MSDITKEQLVTILNEYLLGWCGNDIKTAAIDGDAKMAGFILGCCFIDSMAGFYAGMDKKESKRESGTRFKNFVKKYLIQYDAEKFWFDLRCCLVHSYTEGGTYIFMHKKAEYHFVKASDGRIILNLENFYEDLLKAYENLRSDILSNEESFLKAKKRYDSMGLLQAGSVSINKDKSV